MGTKKGKKGKGPKVKRVKKVKKLTREELAAALKVAEKSRDAAFAFVVGLEHLLEDSVERIEELEADLLPFGAIALQMNCPPGKKCSFFVDILWRNICGKSSSVLRMQKAPWLKARSIAEKV